MTVTALKVGFVLASVFGAYNYFTRPKTKDEAPPVVVVPVKGGHIEFGG